MDTLHGLLSGFEVALTPQNILFVSIGVLVGTIIGMLPGLGPTATIAVLLPVTYYMDPASAIIMLAGIYYGGMYGDRIPSILLNVPGDGSSVITTLDGAPLAKQGRAGSALGITAIGSFIGGTVAIIGLTILAPIIAQFAVRVGPPEMFVLALAGMMMVTFISGSTSRPKALIAAGLGLLVAAIGVDSISGHSRMTFGNLDLAVGIDLVPLAVGLFGIGEILYNIDRGLQRGLKSSSIGNTLPTWADWVMTRAAILRASIIGFFIGVLPGGGGTLSAIVAYGTEKKFSKHPEKFGKGAIDGLAATETADNASSSSAFIPMLTLGLPPNSVLAVIFGALLMQNITPGPQLIETNPDIFWGVIASMYVGNLLLLVLNLPLIRVFVQILRVPSTILFPLIAIVAFAGVYSTNNRVWDVGVALVFGIVGYLFKKFGFDLAPFILAFILGPIIESEFRRSMIMSGGDLGVFFSRPGSGTMAALLIVGVAFSVFMAARGGITSRRSSGTAGQPGHDSVGDADQQQTRRDLNGHSAELTEGAYEESGYPDTMSASHGDSEYGGRSPESKNG